MEKQEKKEIAQIVGEVIDEKVTPRLVKLESGQAKLESGQAKLESGQKKLTELSQVIIEQVVKNSEDIEVIKEDTSDMGYTLERIEAGFDTVMRRQDSSSIKTSQLNRRVLRLESKKS